MINSQNYLSCKHKPRVGNFPHSLKSNEQLWAIHSDRSGQMSDCEPIAQVAHVKRATMSESLTVTHDKWATMSDSLRLLMINGQISKSLKKFDKIYFLVHFLYVFFKQAIRSFPLF